MRFKSSFAFVFALLLLSLSAMTAAAQTAQVSGKVSLRQADGTEAPLQGATVTFHRTDISGKFDVKTNAKGEYVRVGMPFGTYTIAVSAPNAQPTYLPNIPIGQKPDNNFVLSSGDGRVLTLAEIKTLMATPAAGGGQGTETAKISEAEAKRLAAEYEREKAEVEAKNARAVELNAKLPEILKRGNDAFNAKNYEQALASYDEGIAADSSQGVFHLNKAIALRERGVKRYNDALKAKDKDARAAATADIKNSVESLNKAVAAYKENAKTGQANTGAGGAGNPKGSEVLTSLRERAESYRIAMLVGLSELAEPAATGMQEYIDVESDQAQKAKFELALANALRDSGQVDKSVALYRRYLAANPNNMDAMFGLAMALQYDEAKLTENAPEVISLMKQVLAKDTSTGGDRKQAATDSIASMEAIIQQSKQKPANTRRKG